MLPTISNVQTMEQMRRQRYIRYYTSRNKPGSKCLLAYTSCKWYFLNTAPFPRNILKKYFAKQIRNQDPTLNYFASYINMDWICREAPVAAPLSCRWNNSCRRLEDDRVEYRIPSSALNLQTLRTHDIISLCFYDCLWSPDYYRTTCNFCRNWGSCSVKTHLSRRVTWCTGSNQTAGIAVLQVNVFGASSYDMAWGSAWCTETPA